MEFEETAAAGGAGGRNGAGTAHGQLPFPITFASCVGKVKLGMKVNDLLSLLVNEYPRVNYDLIAYSIQEEIQIYIPQWGMRCRFLPRSQSLYLIDILDIQSCPYSLNGVTIFQSNYKTTFKNLQKVLGPSFPGNSLYRICNLCTGKFIDEFYLLQFDGVGLLFSIPTEFQSLYSDGSNLPLELPDGTSPILTRVYICPADYQLLSLAPYRDVAETRVFVNLNKLQLRIILGDRDSILALGMCPQDVLSNIGSPDFSSTHEKSEIFFQHFEYYSLGMTLFFTLLSSFLGLAVYFSRQHRVSQIVLYTNMPCHPDFGRFSRCDYEITYQDPQDDEGLKLFPDTLWGEGEV